jgi:hypothetical protein
MKRKLKVFLILVSLLILIFVGFYIFLIIRAKPIIMSQLEGFLNRKVKIDEVSLSFPLNLEIKNLDIEDLLKTEFVFISPDIFRIFLGKIALSELKITKPKFNFKRGGRQQEQIPLLGKIEEKLRPVPLVSPKRKMKVFLRKVILDKGYIDFSDTLIKPEGISIVVKDLDLKIENLAVPARDEITQFSLKGTIPWQEDVHMARLEASGWMDLYRKDMQADLKIEGIDGVYISPYYSKYLSPEKLGIEKATLNFFSQIQSHKNDLIANCQLELTDLVFKEKPLEEKEKITPQKLVTKVLDIFKTFEGKIVLNFVIRTKMDSPEFRIEDIKMAIEEKISETYKLKAIKPEEVIKLPAKVLEGAIKGTTEVSKAVIGSAKTIGLEIKRALEEAFKKEKKE